MRKFSLCNLQRHCGFNPQSPANNAFRVGIAGQTRNDAKRSRLRLRSVFATMCIGLFLSMANFAFGQYDYVPSKPPIYFYIDWSREDFIKNEVSIMSVYSYQFDENGNIKDSFQTHISQFDALENKIFGKRDGFINFEAYYSTIGLPIKYRKITDEGIDLNSKMRKYVYENLISESEEYEYDSLLNREIKTTMKTISRNYFKNNKNLFLQRIHTEIYEYVYNSNNQKIECYETDSAQYTQYLKTKQKIKTKYNTSFNDPKHLTYQWKYDSLSNLTEWTFIGDSNFVSYKKNY